MAEQTTAIEALRQSLKLEQRGHKFYLDAAARTTDQRGQEMFRSLADDELKHLQAVQRQLEALTAGKTWVTIGTTPTKPLDLDQALLPPDKETLEKTISANASDIEALHFALEFENDAYNLYRKAAQETTDPAGKAMYEWLTQQELDHFNLLMLNYEHLSSSGHWLGLQA
ncbi:MAG: ferritin family protein [Anaerolineae bacterium]|nr:ferritin family protein [Anaerolineae bacterium]